MNARLDHVGIAVTDVRAALAFFHDALGLHVEPPEEVATQHVRAHFLPVGGPHLELLEPTSPASPIARFTGKRGPGLHHITLRVDDLAAVLTHLKARGVRLIDEQPRPGAGGTLVAFVHPSAAHGVLVELNQATPAEPDPVATGLRRFVVGDLELISLCDGYFRLDGGSMFGIVPKVLWERKIAPDDRNRIALAMRPLLIRGDKTVLIDAGIGDKENAKFLDIFGVDRRPGLDAGLAAAGVSPDEIDLVVATHLHFDHTGGFTTRGADGRIRPAFPNARYIIRRGEWEDAAQPHERARASYVAHNFLPLADAGVIEFIEDDGPVMPGVRVRRTGGHTRFHQMIEIESGGRRAAYVADTMPTRAHLGLPWVMGIDLYPVETLEFKRAFLRDAASRETLVFLSHDPQVAAGYVTQPDGDAWFTPA